LQAGNAREDSRNGHWVWNLSDRDRKTIRETMVIYGDDQLGQRVQDVRS
jgi:hypothetical protein